MVAADSQPLQYGALRTIKWHPPRFSHRQHSAVTSPPLRTLITRWREDPGSTYRTWFLWEERLKNFRSIRRGIAQVVEQIEAGTFGNVYRYLPYGELERHRDSMARFGHGIKAIEASARNLT